MSQFHRLSDDKLKERMTEKKVWLDYKNVVEQFLGNVKSLEWQRQVSIMVKSFKKLKYLMSLKLHFMDSYVEYFPENWGLQ